MVRSFIVAAAFFITTQARAAGPAIASVDGASSYNLTGAITVFGGLAGDSCGSAAATNTSTCDSCQSAYATCGTAPLCACNKTRIWDGLIVRINLTKSGSDTFNALAVKSSDSSAITPVTPNNQGNYIDFRWTDICGFAGLGNCEGASATAATFTMKIFIDKDNSGTLTTGEDVTEVTFKIAKPTGFDVYGNTNQEGIYGFRPYPGDEKIYLEDISASGGFPTSMSYGLSISAVRVFLDETNMTNANPSATTLETQDISIVDNGTNLERPIVDGLTNEQTYFFRLGLVDQAQNVVQFFPDALAGDTAPGAGPCTKTPGETTCPYAATPSEVLGLLSKDFNCFIATAAYGTPMEPKIGVFREFRYKILLQNKYGLEFVKAYYKYGPYAARYIADKPVLRAVTRGLLWPFYGFSYLALKIGFASAFAASLLLLSALIALPWWGVRRVSTRE